DLEDDVADEALGDDDFAHALVDVAPLDVADELVLEGAVLEEVLRFLGELVALVLLGADVEQADLGLVALEDVLGEDGAHDAVLIKMFRFGVNVGADVEKDGEALLGGHEGGDAGPPDSLEKEPRHEAAGDHGAGVAGADDRLDLAL